MSNFGSNAIKIELADGSGVLHDISLEVLSINGVETEALTQDGTGFSLSWKKNQVTGMNQSPDITISGLFNDAANTPRALWTRGATREFKVTYDAPTAAHYDDLTVIMAKLQMAPKQGQLTPFTMTLRPTGTVTSVP